MPSHDPAEALRARAQPIPLDAAARGQVAARMNGLASMRMIGARFDLADPQVVRIGLAEVAEHHLGGLGTRAVNGAVIAGLFDAALGMAGTLQFGGQRAGTVELSIKLMRPAFEAPIEVLAIALKHSPHLAFTEAELYAEGRLCAVASGIVAVASSQPQGEAFW
jgi:acyl-coenzyme A thioesterase PaaI-like protein